MKEEGERGLQEQNQPTTIDKETFQSHTTATRAVDRTLILDLEAL